MSDTLRDTLREDIKTFLGYRHLLLPNLQSKILYFLANFLRIGGILLTVFRYIYFYSAHAIWHDCNTGGKLWQSPHSNKSRPCCDVSDQMRCQDDDLITCLHHAKLDLGIAMSMSSLSGSWQAGSFETFRAGRNANLSPKVFKDNRSRSTTLLGQFGKMPPFHGHQFLFNIWWHPSQQSFLNHDPLKSGGSWVVEVFKDSV